MVKPDTEKLKSIIEESGMTMKFVAEKSGMIRQTLHNRLNGVGEFTASEIAGLTTVLRLTKAERDSIFFNQNVQ